MRLSRPRIRTVKVHIQEYIGSQRYMGSTTISVYGATGAEVERIIRGALKANTVEEVVKPRIHYRKMKED